MRIDPDLRGLGPGRRLLNSLETIARGAGLTRVVLDANETLLEAISMYERAGNHQIERYSDHPTQTTGSRRRCS